MSWLAVDKGGCEHILAEKPCRNESNTLWICSVVYLYGRGTQIPVAVTFLKEALRSSSEKNCLGKMSL